MAKKFSRQNNHFCVHYEHKEKARKQKNLFKGGNRFLRVVKPQIFENTHEIFPT